MYISPDLALLERLLTTTCFSDADAAEAAEYQFRYRTHVIDAATSYIHALVQLQRAVDAFPQSPMLPATVTQFLDEVQR